MPTAALADPGFCYKAGWAWEPGPGAGRTEAGLDLAPGGSRLALNSVVVKAPHPLSRRSLMPIRTVDSQGGRQTLEGSGSPRASERRWSPGLTELRPLEGSVFTMSSLSCLICKMGLLLPLTLTTDAQGPLEVM